MSDKIREVALRVGLEVFDEHPHDEGHVVSNSGYNWIDDKLIEFLTRCLQELSKDVEPVCWRRVDRHGVSWWYSPTEDHHEGSIPLYLRPPLTEQDKRDAARWRYARLNGAWESEAWMNSATPEEIDSAIDKAMENGK